MRWLYWTIHPRLGRIAVTRETTERVYGVGPHGPTHRPRRECRGRFETREACIEAWERREETRRRYRARREEISAEKYRMRREEMLALIQATGGPP
jgi:hypothetical protein